MLASLATFPENPGGSIIILKQAFTIEGATSVGDFNCTYQLEQRDTVHVGKTASGDDSILYIIPSDAFGCHNFLLNRDFRKTIKAKEFKDIRVEMCRLRKDNHHYMCDLKLKLAGKEKMYEKTSLKTTANGVTGTLVVQFSEFDLTPPKKFGGLVKVKEEIKISVNLTLQ
ncbi:MAG: hypothetical protein DI539_06300 [Flavobacterium psychrophilum]|nr:MAG: hypothetical protein DI539_06300 [Flavobacterium psychrophilum]